MNTDYTKLRKLHPKAKVGNIKSLIKMIEDSGYWKTDLLNARIDPPKVNGRRVTYSMASRSINGARAMKKSRVPISFNMSTFGRVARDEDGHVCGTAACSAGFAVMLSARAARSKAALDRIDDQSWESTLADFMGIDAITADDMTAVGGPCPESNGDVKPRHAVRLLEIFLETGEVDWARALGWRKAAGGLAMTKAEEKMREKETEAHTKLRAEVVETSLAA